VGVVHLIVGIRELMRVMKARQQQRDGAR
jgi:hypothetical protein